eukprot:1083515-Amphidinium_carterae.1
MHPGCNAWYCMVHQHSLALSLMPPSSKLRRRRLGIRRSECGSLTRAKVGASVSTSQLHCSTRTSSVARERCAGFCSRFLSHSFKLAPHKVY